MIIKYFHILLLLSFSIFKLYSSESIKTYLDVACSKVIVKIDNIFRNINNEIEFMENGFVFTIKNLYKVKRKIFEVDIYSFEKITSRYKMTNALQHPFSIFSNNLTETVVFKVISFGIL